MYTYKSLISLTYCPGRRCQTLCSTYFIDYEATYHVYENSLKNSLFIHFPFLSIHFIHLTIQHRTIASKSLIPEEPFRSMA